MPELGGKRDRAGWISIPRSFHPRATSICPPNPEGCHWTTLALAQRGVFGAVRVAATFPSLSTTSPLGTAQGNTASPGEGSTSPAPSRGARGTRPRCCPRGGSRRPGGTRCGGSPGAGRCGSPAPGCRRWSVPPSCGLSPSPAAEGSPACRRWPRAASAHRPRPAPETR